MFRALLVVLVALLLGVGCSSTYGTSSTPTKAPSAAAPSATAASGSATTASGQVVDVTIEGFAFNPKTVTVARGTTVRWTQKDSAAHTVTSDKGTFDSGSLAQGKTFSYKFDSAATYDYHCNFHSNMKATVIVQ